MLNKKDISIVRELAERVAEVAALPVQEEKRELWRKLNSLNPSRPMVMIDQVCWNEMNFDGELDLLCTDEECRKYEEQLRQTLFQWSHFPVDMVVESFIGVPKAIRNSGFGIGVWEETITNDPTSVVLSHKYDNQLQTEADLEKIRMPEISHDITETERRLAVSHELFDSLLELRPLGYDPYLSLWDPIATWMGIEDALFAIMDKPEFMHRVLTRMTEGYLGMLDQLEEQGLLCEPQGVIHCTGAYTDELPAPEYDPDRPRTKDLWMFGMAQMLSTVSPKMLKEFEVDYTSRICERFGLVYYGCCEPLDLKMAEVRMIPKVRKISMSPWANQERGAREIGSDYVFSCKPNPAVLATDIFSPGKIKSDLISIREICESNDCPLEIILKDISTVRYAPERIFEWARIAMDVVEA